jgi:hypothetical protein
MDLEAQIGLMTVPQEFVRLCNAVLRAQHGEDFLAIDDDRGDRGNDGYLKSEKRMYAAHCFKRVQNQSLDDAIRTKMIGDLGKAIALKNDGAWDVDAWTFISNYPIPETIAERVTKTATNAGIDASWQGPPFLADGVRNHGLAESFPELHVSQVDAKLSEIQGTLEAMSNRQEPADGDTSPSYNLATVPKTPEQQQILLAERPPGWEYLLYAGVLWQGREDLERKWHDEELGMPRSERVTLEEGSEFHYLSRAFARIRALTSSSMRVFDLDAQERAFGAPGEPGDPVRIENLAWHVINTYEALLDWAAEMRAVVPPDDLEHLFETTALIAKAPITQFHDFVDDVVRELGKLPAHLAGDRSELLEINISLVLKIDPVVLAEFEAEIERVGPRF